MSVLGDVSSVAAMAALVPQDSAGMSPLPADPPIEGPLWTIAIPALLFVGSFLGTYFLYKRFAKAEGE